MLLSMVSKSHTALLACLANNKLSRYGIIILNFKISVYGSTYPTLISFRHDNNCSLISPSKLDIARKPKETSLVPRPNWEWPGDEAKKNPRPVQIMQILRMHKINCSNSGIWDQELVSNFTKTLSMISKDNNYCSQSWDT